MIVNFALYYYFRTVNVFVFYFIFKSTFCVFNLSLRLLYSDHFCFEKKSGRLIECLIRRDYLDQVFLVEVVLFTVWSNWRYLLVWWDIVVWMVIVKVIYIYMWLVQAVLSSGWYIISMVKWNVVYALHCGTTFSVHKLPISFKYLCQISVKKKKILVFSQIFLII